MTRSDDAELLRYAGRLTDRDHQVSHLLHEHRVLTAPQVADAYFRSLRKAQRRLRQLHDWRVLDRVQPRRHWKGSEPFHYSLGPLGARLVAADNATTLAALGWRPADALALVRGQRLDHLVGLNGVFTALMRAARDEPTWALEEWWSEARCAAAWGHLVRPDGYGIWTEGTRRLPFLLEYDTGTEPHARLVAKLNGYRRLRAAVGHPTWLLFRFPSRRRETEVRRALADKATGLSIATAAPEHRDAPWDPSGPVWLPLHPPAARRRLVDLGRPA